MSTTYEETDLDEDPVLIPRCGHLMTMSSMDGVFEMQKTFEMSEHGHPTVLNGVSLPFSSESLKNCPMCRSPLRDINRYNRIVRRGLIDESTKKFILWSNATFAPLAARVQDLESDLANTQSANPSQLGRNSLTVHEDAEIAAVKLHGDSIQFLNYIQKVSDRKPRYQKAMRFWQAVNAFLRRVSDSEQPYGRVWDLVENERRRNGKANPQFSLQVDVLQPRCHLLTQSLLTRCNLAIISDFLNLRSRSFGPAAPNDLRTMPLDIDFTLAMDECTKLAIEAQHRYQPLTEVEACVYFARFAALERSYHSIENASANRRDWLHEKGLEQLEIAEAVSENHPGSVKGMNSQIDTVRLMLNDGVFHSVVTSKETQEVYRALAQEFRGTGHWYTCINGHPFTVGECGMPMEQAQCPQCGSPVGGRSHQNVEGVTRFTEMDRAMGDLTLGNNDL